MRKNPKILIGLLDVAGTASDLSEGFKSLGLDSIFVSRENEPFEYKDGNWLSKALHRLASYSSKASGRSKLLRELCRLISHLFRGGIFLWALLSRDVFIFYFNATFSDKNRDLPILKFFKKTIIFIYVGSDSRPPFLNGSVDVNLENAQDVEMKLIKGSFHKKQRIKYVEKYADYIINWLPHSYYHERPVVLGNIIGLPKQIKSELKLEPQVACSEQVMILHAPSKPEVKGSRLIREIISRLKAKGYKINYIEIVGQPNEVVISHLNQCDFVVDQMYSDTPMAGFATEAAFCGKPAVVGGYFADFICDYVPEYAIPPSAYTTPDKVEQTIERLITDRDYRLALGSRARHYAEHYLRPEMVAERILRLINDEVPADWYRDPANFMYCHGCGLSEYDIKRRVRLVIERAGVSALQLSDKPEIEKNFVCFVNKKESH